MKLRICADGETIKKIDDNLKTQEATIEKQMKSPQVRMGNWLTRRAGMLMIFTMNHVVTEEKTIELVINFTGADMIKQSAILDKVKTFVKGYPDVKIEIIEEPKSAE